MEDNANANNTVLIDYVTVVADRIDTLRKLIQTEEVTNVATPIVMRRLSEAHHEIEEILFLLSGDKCPDCGLSHYNSEEDEE